MFGITPSARLRPSPFYESTVAEGVQSFTTYNNMLMPTGYGDPEGEYWRLINGVSMWDVAVERQIELHGPDAGRLAQILSPRDLGKCVEGQGKYVALCNHAGTLINDPILLKLAEDRYWLSIADSNILFWARAVASERGLDVAVSEADVSPLAVQGPKAEDVVASLFGDWVRDLKYFWFSETEIDGIPVAVARSGWSKQGGFEIYLMDGSKGAGLWDRVKEAGKPFDIGPGNPNACERIESGLLSWGGDTDDATNPYEVRLGPFVDLDVADDVVGIKALRAIKAEGPKRHQLGAVLENDEPTALPAHWYDILVDGEKVGDLTNCVWSYRLKRNIGFALVSTRVKPGAEVVVHKDGWAIPAALSKLPFI
ncbi:glycine cleavage T C-terminal barrel domain-containing protein [Nitratireductor sp. XY-223]|uniref:glycine cleavage T C-terminal barrel domain-containing protein n=1 Tax=Nitratireductor sp. XY-223 TaxID=2561926 RepID=UPI0010AAAA82|nr:glycine cleavage T C-terminal barrel domain-containing protein [Nitratireductor sp. XY-223]